MSLDIERLVVTAQVRLAKSREIAAAFRDDRDVHRHLMRGVFALEDLLFLLHEMATRSQNDEPECRRRS